jgi:hypothetical protein
MVSSIVIAPKARVEQVTRRNLLGMRVRARNSLLRDSPDYSDKLAEVRRRDAVPLIQRREPVIQAERHDPAGSGRMQQGPQPHPLVCSRAFLYDDHVGL